MPRIMTPQAEKTLSFLQEQRVHTPNHLYAYVYTSENTKRPQRNIYVTLQKYFEDYMNGLLDTRWVVMAGLRGAGKTTLLAQMYDRVAKENVDVFYFSLDRSCEILHITLNQLVEGLETLLGKSIESLDRPLVLLLDEVHYDPQWELTLKTIYDRTNKVFIISTGSSALHLNSSPDSARRRVSLKLYPMTFPEFLKISKDKYPIKGLCNTVRKAILESENAFEVYSRLQEVESLVSQYYDGVTQSDFQKYLWHGSLPFMKPDIHEALIYDQIQKTLDKVIHSDMNLAGNFSSAVLSQVSAILYAVADMDALAFSKLEAKFGIARGKIAEIFQALEKTEVLRRIYPYGSHLSQVSIRKPSKYIFSSPAFRAMYYKVIGSIISDDNAKGKLYEDLVGMYLTRVLETLPATSLTYDGEQGGADFIINIASKKKIVIEVGAGSKGYRQVIQTSKKVKADYGLVLSSDSLDYSEEYNAVKIPHRIFLLT